MASATGHKTQSTRPRRGIIKETPETKLNKEFLKVLSFQYKLT